MPHLHPLERHFLSECGRFQLTQSAVLLAVSGGADSLALLLCSNAVGLKIEAACLDHGLRSSAAAEVDTVRALCEARKVPFHTRKLQLAPGAGLEARARAARYAALEEIRSSRGLDVIATAHTATDQAETVLMRLGRGSSLRGAGAILERRDGVVRPLLFATREEVRAYVAENGLTPVDDPMNRDPSFQRVRVRQDVLPAMQRALGSEAVRRVAAFAPLAAEDEALLSELAEAAHARLRLQGGGLDAVGVRALARPLRRRVLARLLEDAGVAVDQARIQEALRIVEEGQLGTVGKGWLLRAQAGILRISLERPPEPNAPALELRNLDGAEVEDEAAGLNFRWSTRPPADQELGLSVGSALPPFTIRRRRAGDRVAHRKLQDVLVDARVPEEYRDALPVITDARGALIWVVGVWPARSTGPSGTYLIARPAGEERARDWLIRYRLRVVGRRAK